MQQSSFHHANMLAEQVQISINYQDEQRDQQLMELMHNVINQVSHTQTSTSNKNHLNVRQTLHPKIMCSLKYLSY